MCIYYTHDTNFPALRSIMQSATFVSIIKSEALYPVGVLLSSIHCDEGQ